MKMRLKVSFPCVTFTFGTVLLFASLSSAISTKQIREKENGGKAKTVLKEVPADSVSRQGYPHESEEPIIYVPPPPPPPSFRGNRLRKSNNGSASAPSKTPRIKEDTPVSDEVESNDNSDKLDLTRESRGDDLPRLYYDDGRPRYPQHATEEEADFENTEGKAKDTTGKFYFPKNYINSKYSDKKPAQPGTGSHFDPPHNPGIREFILSQSHHHEPGHHHDTSGHMGNYHHEDYEQGHHPVHTPDGHGVEDTVKGISGHLAIHGPGHHGHGYVGSGYTKIKTLEEKVDTLGKALQLLIPSALLITGVSALFPNRVHVPTTPNKYRQRRSAPAYRRRGPQRRLAARLAAPVHIHPEFDDIPSHVLQAEHRILDDNMVELYPDYASREEASSMKEHHGTDRRGFDPFRVFKGPGPEKVSTVQQMEDSIPLMPFPHMPDVVSAVEGNPDFIRVFEVIGPDGQKVSSKTYGPNMGEVEEQPPAQNAPGGGGRGKQPGNEGNVRTQIIRRKVTRKPALFVKEASKLPSHAQLNSHYLAKDSVIGIVDAPPTTQTRAEQEFMTTLKSLVTPDIAKAIVENKKEPPKNVDLSPDGPVMGLLTSFAQHEKDSPSCQKRALCELAVRGKSTKASKFEAFLWSVATLVPDVFSEMYDLQEVFQAIRNERCIRFECSHPNLDLQM